MAFVDDPNQNQQGQQVAGSTPLSGGQPTTAPEASGGSVSGSGSSPMQPTSQGSESPQTVNKGSGKASSGQYTNIQKYVAKNQPQAQKMATEQLQNVKDVTERTEKKQKDLLSQFTKQAQSSGLQNTAENVANIEQYTRQEAGLTPQPEQPSQFSQDQFQNILNAQYTGPKSLVESGNLYRQMEEQARSAGRTGELSQTTEGRNQLLRDVYAKGNREYSQGSQGLDALLLGQQTDTLRDIEQAGSQIGSSQDILNRATSQAGNIADQTRADVQATREQARQAFQDVASERQGQIDQRIDAVVQNWDTLPQYFRDAMSNPDGTINLSAVEAATLGVQSGEGLYNLTAEDLFGTTEDPAVAAERARLISQQEQGNLARLQALSNLANPDASGNKLYDIGDYFNADIAGTQDAYSALNLPEVRKQLAEAERAFRADAAKNLSSTKKDYERYSRGWGQARGKAYGKATVSGSLKDVLEQQGYDFSSDVNDMDTSNLDILKNLGNAVDMNSVSADEGLDLVSPSGYGDLAQLEPITGESVGDIVNRVSGGVSDLSDNIKGAVGNDIATLSGIAPTLDLAAGLGNIAGNVSTSLFGGGKSSARKKAQRSAQRKALADLQNQLTNKFKASGFQNRLNVADNEQTQARTQQLLDILRNLDKTNVGE